MRHNRWQSMQVMLCAGLLLLSLMGFAQGSGQSELCGFDLLLEQRLKSDPGYAKELEELNEQVAQWQQQAGRAAVNGTYYIPVVFHIVTSSYNITGANGWSVEYEMYDRFQDRIQPQLVRLNSEFLGANIQFCLAQTAPPSYEGVSGQGGTWQSISDGVNPAFSSVGVTYHVDDTLCDFQSSNTGHVNSMNMLLPFNEAGENKYLDIYVVDDVVNPSIGGLLGEAPYGLGAAFDDITIEIQVFGDETNGTSAGSLLPAGNQGKVAVHEVGHWLLLKHTFADDGACPGFTYQSGDHVADTPPQDISGLNASCGAFSTTTTCNGSTPIYHNNHMDYGSDGCKVTTSGVNPFTNGQNSRMQAFVDIRRSDWHSTLNRIRTGIETTSCISGYSPQIFTAEFEMSTTLLCADESFELTGMPIDHLPSGAVISSWQFTFTEVNGAVSPQTISSSGNVPVSATVQTGGAYAPGTYTVSLTVNYFNGSSGSVMFTYPEVLIIEDCSASPYRYKKSFAYQEMNLSDLAIVSTDFEEGGYLISGTNNISQSEKEVVVFKVNLLGEIMWQHSFEFMDTREMRCFDIIKAAQGENQYLLTGYYRNGGNEKEMFVLQFEDQGGSCMLSPMPQNPVFIPAKTVDIKGNDLRNSVGLEIINTSDGGYAIAGTVARGFGDTDSKMQLLVKLNQELNVMWIEEFEFSQKKDVTDFDAANSVVEILQYEHPTNPGSFVAAYFLGGTRSKQMSGSNQGISSLIIEDNGSQRDVVTVANNTWGTPSENFDYATDALYDANEHVIYQKAFTKLTHGVIVVKIDPSTASIIGYVDANFLNINEYMGFKMIHSNNGQELVMNGCLGSNPLTMKVNKANWPQLGSVGTGVFGSVLPREYTGATLVSGTEPGPSFPRIPSFSPGNQHFYYSPKSLCTSPNGGYMHVVATQAQSGSTGTQLTLLKLDESLRSGCAMQSAQIPEPLFSPILVAADLIDNDITEPGEFLVVADMPDEPAPCSDICFGEYEIYACTDGDGYGVFDLEASMADLLGAGYTFQWYENSGHTVLITNVNAYAAGPVSTTVYAHIVTPDGCNGYVDVHLESFGLPAANDIIISSGSTVDLVALEAQVTDVGNTVQWYSDIARTIPVPNPNAFAGTVAFATITSPQGCEAEATVTVRCGSLPWPVIVSNGFNRETISDIITDQNGVFYITGYFIDTWDCIGGSATTSTPSNAVFYVAKFNPCGFEWVRYDTYPTASSRGSSLALDANGDVYVSGECNKNIQLTTYSHNFSPQTTGFVAKYSSSGVFQWLTEASSSAVTNAEDVSVDLLTDDVYFTGRISATQSSPTSYYVIKLDISGATQWSLFDLTSNAETEGKALHALPGGSVAVTGSVVSGNQFDIGGMLTPATNGNSFVATIDGAGNGVNSIIRDYYSDDLIADASGDIFVTGSNDAAGFNEGGTAYGNSIPGVFLARYDANLSNTWVRLGVTNSTGPGRHLGTGMAFDQSGSIFLTGQFCESMKFGSIGLISTSPSSGAMDYFVVKYQSNGTEEWGLHTYSGYDASSYITTHHTAICHDHAGYAYMGGILGHPMSFGTYGPFSPGGVSSEFFMARIEDLGSSGAFQKEEKTFQFDDEQGDADLAVFPNPSRGAFSVQLLSLTETIEKISVLDLQGKVVFVSDKGSAAGVTQELDLGLLSSGMYYLRVASSRHQYMQKIVIQK